MRSWRLPPRSSRNGSDNETVPVDRERIQTVDKVEAEATQGLLDVENRDARVETNLAVVAATAAVVAATVAVVAATVAAVAATVAADNRPKDL